MMKKISTKIVLANICLLMVAVGCARHDERAKDGDAASSREMQEAIAAERLGEYDRAIKLYQDTIDAYKSAPLAHLQLALLLHEYRRDYLAAIYHYRRYIETAGMNSTGKGATRDFTIVSNRIEKVGQLLSAQYVRAIADSEDSEGVRIRKNYAELDNKVAKLSAQNETLAESNATLRAEIVRLNNKIDNQLLWIKRIQSSPTDGVNAGKLDSVTITDTDGKEKVLQTYEVRKGDSLSVIAEYVYGDRTQWPRIRDANPDKVKNGDRVKPGDVLIIP